MMSLPVMRHGYITDKIGRNSSNAIWAGENEPPGAIIRRNKFESKTLFCSFFNFSGPVLIHKVDKGKTINYDYYISIIV